LKKILLYLFLLIIVGIGARLWWLLHDRFPGYAVNIDIKNTAPAPLKAGFTALVITPAVPDGWTDKNHDAQYNPEDGDTWQDKNGNGRFDAVWIAGFQNKRPAQGIHDDLWARAMVLDDGTTRLAIVAIDAIGLGHDDVVRIRQLVPAAAEVDYVVVHSTHTHEGPDLIGMWGDSEYTCGVNPDYLRQVQQQAAAAVAQAAKALRPARIRIAEDAQGAADLVMDTRKPNVTDPGLRIMQAIDAENGATLGTFVQWANHPETTWNENLLLSSDFCHYVRASVEKGIFHLDSLRTPGVGGVCVYVNGGIGGLMTTVPDYGVRDLFTDTIYVAPSFDKARAQGERLALLALNALRADTAGVTVEKESIRLRAQTFDLPLDNPLYRLGAAMGVFKRGLSGWLKIRTEVACWQLGPATVLHQPGEIYPEILHGGIEQPEGQDFALSPQEIPPVYDLMPGRFKFTVGLSNDEIGYILPKSQWDAKAPYTYSLTERPYGEINSVGPETGPIVYQQIKAILGDLSRKE
jgi:hypothetical protein